MRTVFTLDRGTIEARAAEEAAHHRGAKVRGWTLPLLPILGLAPARLQQRWADSWGYSAEKATWLSIIASLLIGALGLIQSMALAFGGEWFLSSWLRPLAFIGPFLFAEGMLRSALVAADGEPVGSVFGWPLNVFWKPPKRDPEVMAPRVRKFDGNTGNLELESPVHRRDWHSDGILGYRGQAYRLEGVAVEGEVWVYRFAHCADEMDAQERLRLIPPAPPKVPPQHDPSRPSVLRTALVTAAVTLGPQRDQEIWAEYMNLRPIWLTIFGAGAELIGALINFGKDVDRGAPLLLLVNLYLIGEGLLRLGYVVLHGRPLGSVLGLALRPLYRRWFPEPNKSR